VELETDIGLTGVGAVRTVNKTDSFLATVEELAAGMCWVRTRSTRSGSPGR